MAVHYYPGIVAYFFWPVKILTPLALDLAGGSLLGGLERRLERCGLVRSVRVLDRDVDAWRREE